MKYLIFLCSALALLVGLFFSVTATEKNNHKYSDLRVTQIAGKKLFDLKNCSDCHTLAEKGEGQLTPVTNKRDDSWFDAHVEKESPIVLRETKSKRRQKRVLQAEIEALTDFLYDSGTQEKERIANIPENIFEGAYLAYQNNCLNCHTIAGHGKEIAPDLTHIADEHGDKAWLIENLKNPQQFSKESPMPKFDNLPEKDLERIAEYLLTLKK